MRRVPRPRWQWHRQRLHPAYCRAALPRARAADVPLRPAPAGATAPRSPPAARLPAADGGPLDSGRPGRGHFRVILSRLFCFFLSWRSDYHACERQNISGLYKVTIRKQGTQYFAQRENEPGIYELDAKAVEDLEKAAADVKEAAPEATKKK